MAFCPRKDTGGLGRTISGGNGEDEPRATENPLPRGSCCPLPPSVSSPTMAATRAAPSVPGAPAARLRTSTAAAPRLPRVVASSRCLAVRARAAPSGAQEREDPPPLAAALRNVAITAASAALAAGLAAAANAAGLDQVEAVEQELNSSFAVDLGGYAVDHKTLIYGVFVGQVGGPLPPPLLSSSPPLPLSFAFISPCLAASPYLLPPASSSPAPLLAFTSPFCSATSLNPLTPVGRICLMSLSLLCPPPPTLTCALPLCSQALTRLDPRVAAR